MLVTCMDFWKQGMSCNASGICSTQILSLHICQESSVKENATQTEGCGGFYSPVSTISTCHNLFFFFFTPGLSCSSEKETCKQMANSSFLSEKKKNLYFLTQCFSVSLVPGLNQLLFKKKRQQHIFPGDLSFLSTSSLANVSGLVLVSWTVWLVFWPNLFSINCDYSPLLKEVKLNCLSCASYFKIFS